jgi:hypothetical protein
MGLLSRWSADSRVGWRTSAPVLVRLRGERDGFRRVIDIGRGGLRLTTPLPLSVGAPVRVRLRFPDLAEELDVDARVAWRRRGGEVGLDCRELDGETRGLLQVLIDHQDVLARVHLDAS